VASKKRIRQVWYLRQRSHGDQQVSQEWTDLVPEFLRDVWPRHKAAKSPKTSARLCDFAFSDPKLFPRIADTVANLVAKAPDQHLVLANLQDDSSTIASDYPNQVLALLAAVLPDDVFRWPYGIEGILQRLEQAEPLLTKDERLIELKRKWNAR
jgi:hypothetical protein